MHSTIRRCVAFVVAAAFQFAEVGAPTAAGAVAGSGLRLRAAAPLTALAQPAQTPPQRIAVPQPSPRARMPLPPLGSIHAAVSHDVHVAHGVPGQGPPMLRPGQIDGVLASVRQRAMQARSQRPQAVQPPATRPVAPGGMRGGTAPGNSGGRGVRTAQFTAGTGINPWWRYQEENVPGGGRLMVNVGTGNLLLQDDDMSVPHKGIAMAFRRTYNSQSQHDVIGSDGSALGMYGNGWTNTFDAHLSSSAANITTVWDIDGAHYDYTLAADGVAWIPPAGQHATLTWDHGCGYLWTKKSGTSYYFWQAPNGPCGPTYGGQYAGKLYQIIGRNRNTYITFGYSWDIGTHTAGDKVAAISATTESGMTATLWFADVSGHRLLQEIGFPDGATYVTYLYDAAGNLLSVSRPPNNAAGTRPVQTFGYYATGGLMGWVASPRWNGTDSGALFYLGYNGTTAPSATVAAIAHVGSVNPTIADSTGGGALQSGYATGLVEYLHEWFGTGVPTPTFHDTDGHTTNWVVDSLGRPTQTQECTATVGWSCTGTWLVSNETWDAANNLVSEVDPRGNETDYLYDPMGNTTAVGEPSTATSQGTFKPTKLYDYDAYNNVAAYCDENETHTANADWTPIAYSVSTNESPCASQAGSVPHYRATYTYPSYEPYGEVSTITTPMGYTRSFAYAAAQQAGNDYGLPTSITGTAFSQADGSTLTPTKTFWYDATGYARCFSEGQGTSVLTYDALGRITSVADPDDSSANASSLCAKNTGQPGWNTQATYTYFPGGMQQSSQTPKERAGGVATTFTYDTDRNLTTETHHYACTSGTTCTPGVTTKWYDGAGRLVEVGLPHDPSDYYESPWLTRYSYDLSSGGTVTLGGAAFRAYGHVFKTQEWVPPAGSGAPAWRDLRGAAFDALDRVTTKYAFAPSSNTTLRATTMAYDATAATLGMLASTTDPLGETTSFTYDAASHTTAVQFSGDGGVTPNKSFIYDAMGRVTSATGAVYGTETTRYDNDGRVAEVDEPTSGSITSPARVTYDYYPDGSRKDLNVASAALNASPLMSYAYRADGKRRMVHVGFGQQQGNFVTSYTDSGRTISRSDPFTGTAMPNPRSPVAPGTLYGPTTWTYDTTGQVSSKQLPQTFAYQAIARDDEAVITQWTGSNSANGPATMTFQNTIRGENTYESLGSSASASYNVRIANGAAVRFQQFQTGHSGPPSTGLATSVDPTNAVMASTSNDVYLPSSDPDVPGWINCGNQTTTNDYDGASRLVSRTQTISGMPQNQDCANAFSPAPNVIPKYSYDAENHHVSAATMGASADVQWSPSGRAYKFLTSAANVHYDGGGILFVTDQNGALSQVKVETMADIDGSGQLAVLDRDFGNQYVSRHNNTFYGGIWLGSTIYTNKDTPPTSIPYVFWGSTNDTTCRTTYLGTSCDRAGAFEYGRLEGFEYAGLTFQGARAVESSSGQWTTPDAFAGTVHDPMSQKAFMWDRNNAYAYSDPTGFSPQRSQSANEDGSWAGMSSAGRDVAAADDGTLKQDVESSLTLTYEHFKGQAKDDKWPAADMASWFAGYMEKKGYSTSTAPAKNGFTVRVDAFSYGQTGYVGFGNTGRAQLQMVIRGTVINNQHYDYRYQWEADRNRGGQLFWRQSSWPSGKWLPLDYSNPYVKG